MQVNLSGIRLGRGKWGLSADGTFKPGIHLISGAIGSGKSTLSLIIAGLAKPDSGSIQTEGIRSTMLSMQFPEYHVTGHTVAEEIRTWGLEPEDILSDIELSGREGDNVLSLSRGELKRLHLACVLSLKRDLLILDEPFSTLDCTRKQKLCRSLENAPHGIIIIFTHEQCILPKVDYIWEMEDGMLYERGAVPDALRRWNGAPGHVTHAISGGVVPDNIRLRDAMEALCRTHD